MQENFHLKVINQELKLNNQDLRESNAELRENNAELQESYAELRERNKFLRSKIEVSVSAMNFSSIICIINKPLVTLQLMVQPKNNSKENILKIAQIKCLNKRIPKNST